MRIISTNRFSGVDESANFDGGLGKASNILNFRIDGNGNLVKRQGVRAILTAPNDIEGIWCGKINGVKSVVYSANGNLYSIKYEDAKSGEKNLEFKFLGSPGRGKCNMFEFGGILYIKSTTFYCKYNGSTLSMVSGYVPTIAIGCSPDGDGTVWEQINLLTNKRRQLFSGDASKLVYRLAEKEISGVISVKFDGVDCTIDYSVDKAKGELSFRSAPPAGLNNVEIIYTKDSGNEDKKRIIKCTHVMRFGGNSDGRLFLWGNPEFPNYRFHSDLADGIPSAEYFPVNAFTIIGNNSINCIVQQYDRQLIFTETDAYYSYYEIRRDELGKDFASFPVFNLNGNKGCLFSTDGCIIDNNPITLCFDGLNKWESTSIQNEKNAICFSSPIRKTLNRLMQGDISNAYIFDYQNYHELFFVCGDTACVFDYENDNWYFYDGFSGSNFVCYGDSIFFSRGSILYIFGNEIPQELNRECRWESPFINGESRYGRLDITRVEADLLTFSGNEPRFEFRCDRANSISRALKFKNEALENKRISLRPNLKRAMPFSICFIENGKGDCELHNLTLKIRDKERSSRNGVC